MNSWEGRGGGEGGMALICELVDRALRATDKIRSLGGLANSYQRVLLGEL